PQSASLEIAPISGSHPDERRLRLNQCFSCGGRSRVRLTSPSPFALLLCAQACPPRRLPSRNSCVLLHLFPWCRVRSPPRCWPEPNRGRSGGSDGREPTPLQVYLHASIAAPVWRTQAVAAGREPVPVPRRWKAG